MESLLSQVIDEESRDDADADHENDFSIKVPPVKNWAKDLRLDLIGEEADFFYHRIISTAKNKLIAVLLQDADLWNLFMASEGFMQSVRAVDPGLPEGNL